MPLIIFAYLALGLVAQCLAFTARPDWTDLATWLHIVLWPGFLADLAAAGLHRVMGNIPLLDVVVCALLLAALAGVRLARRAAARPRVAPVPRTEIGSEFRNEPAASGVAQEKLKIEPRFSTPMG